MAEAAAIALAAIVTNSLGLQQGYLPHRQLAAGALTERPGPSQSTGVED